VPAWLQAPERFLFGRDFFISYSRRDAAAYAANLAKQLGEEHSCYLDQLATPRGVQLPAPIRRELRRATVLALIGSPGALQSPYVRTEIELFVASGRPVLLVDVAGGLEAAPWMTEPWSHLLGVYRHQESADALSRAEPSPAVVAYLRDSFTFTRQDRRLRLASGGAAMLLASVVTGASIISAVTRRRAAEAARRAEQARAEEAIARAHAEEQRRIAASRRLANDSAVRLGAQPDLGLLLASRAYQTAPTVEARQALLSGLTRYPGLSRILRDASTTELHALARSADGRVVATGNRRHTTIWDATTLEPRLHVEEPGENLRGLALSPDGSLVAIARSRHVTLVDGRTGHAIGTVPDSNDQLAFVDQSRLVIGGERAVTVWDVSTPSEPADTRTVLLEQSLQALVTHPSGWVIVAAYDQLLGFDTNSDDSVPERLTEEGGLLLMNLAITSSPDVALLAGVSAAGRLNIWDLATGHRAVNLSVAVDLASAVANSGGGRDMFVVALSPDGTRAAIGSARGRLTLADTTSLASYSQALEAGAQQPGKLDAELALFGMNPFGFQKLTYAPGVVAMTFAGESTRLLIAQLDGGFSVWDPDGRSPIEAVRPWPNYRIPTSVHGVSNNGRHVAYDDGQHGLWMWDMQHSDPPLPLEPLFERGPMVCTVSDDGQVVGGVESAAGDAQYRTLGLWAADGRLLSRTLIDPQLAPGVETRTYPQQLVFGGPNGRLAALALGDGTVVIWDVSAPAPRVIGASRFRTERIAVSPIQVQAAIVEYKGAVSVWDPVEDRLEPLPGEATDVKALAYSADGSTLAAVTVSSESVTLLVWDVASRQQRPAWTLFENADRSFVPGSAEVTDPNHVAISRDGRLLALCRERALDLWDTNTRAFVISLTLPKDAESVTFDRDNGVLVGHADGVSRIELDPAQLIALTRYTASRELTPAEARRYLDASTSL